MAITTKLKICSVCGDTCRLWVSNPKMCKNCAQLAKSREAKEIKPLSQTEDGKPAQPFKVSRLNTTYSAQKKKSPTADQINQKNKLNQFFEEQASQVPERCENCGKNLNAFSVWAKRCVSAHILGKANFKSVATYPGNIMFLGVGMFSDCFCHSEWDNSDAAYRKTMPIYNTAIERAQKFYHLLTPAEQVQADKYLGQEVVV